MLTEQFVNAPLDRFVSSFFQFIFLLACAPLNLVPGLGSSSSWYIFFQEQIVEASRFKKTLIAHPRYE